MKYLFRFVLLALAFMMMDMAELQAQIRVSRVTDQNTNVTQDGFYYALPQTVLKIDLVYEEIRKIKGPLSNYTENYLGTSEYIRSNATEYRILDVKVSNRIEADPDQLYYVQFPAEKGKDEKAVAFHLSSVGTLLAVDADGVSQNQTSTPAVDQTIIVMEGDDDFRTAADYHRKRKVDTITRKITIDTVNINRFIFKTSWVDKSAEDKADEAAMRIQTIREGRFNLLTGYQEVNYGESMKYMDKELQKMEQEYMELFLGKTVKTVQTQTVYVTPKKGVGNMKVLEFGDGSSLNLSITPKGAISKLPPQAAEKPENIYYRIPEQTTVVLEYDSEVVYRNSMPIGQLGVVAAAPLKGMRSQFDPETGGLTKIVRE